MDDSIQNIIKKLHETFDGKEGFYDSAINRLQQVADHSGVTVSNFYEYAAAEAAEHRHRAEYCRNPAVSRFYHENVSISEEHGVEVMDLVIELARKL